MKKIKVNSDQIFVPENYAPDTFYLVINSDDEYDQRIMLRTGIVINTIAITFNGMDDDNMKYFEFMKQFIENATIDASPLYSNELTVQNAIPNGYISENFILEFSKILKS